MARATRTTSQLTNHLFIPIPLTITTYYHHHTQSDKKIIAANSFSADPSRLTMSGFQGQSGGSFGGGGRRGGGPSFPRRIGYDSYKPAQHDNGGGGRDSRLDDGYHGRERERERKGGPHRGRGSRGNEYRPDLSTPQIASEYRVLSRSRSRSPTHRDRDYGRDHDRDRDRRNHGKSEEQRYGGNRDRRDRDRDRDRDRGGQHNSYSGSGQQEAYLGQHDTYRPQDPRHDERAVDSHAVVPTRATSGRIDNRQRVDDRKRSASPFTARAQFHEQSSYSRARSHSSERHSSRNLDGVPTRPRHFDNPDVVDPAPRTRAARPPFHPLQRNVKVARSKETSEAGYAAMADLYGGATLIKLGNERGTYAYIHFHTHHDAQRAVNARSDTNWSSVVVKEGEEDGGMHEAVLVWGRLKRGGNAFRNLGD